MKKLLMILVVFGVLLSGCTSVLVTSTATNPTEITVPLLTEESTPTEVFVTPIPTVIPTPEIPSEHLPVTLEDVKNVKLSYEISVNEEGFLIGLPEGLSEEEKSLVTDYTKAIQNKFLGSKVFYNKDEETGKWLLFARLEENLFHRVITAEDGSKRFADYPFKFEPSASGVGYKVADFYKVIPLQSESIDVIWKEGVPQIVYDEVEILPDRDRYFTKYLVYDAGVSSTESNLWAEVPGVVDLLILAPTPEISDKERTLDPISTFSISEEYMGVKIDANIIVDKTISDSISSLSFYDKGKYAEFVARVVFSAWWVKGDVSHSSLASEDDFKEYMVLWSKAQQTNEKVDWEKVQLYDVWANNLDDGDGYIQKKYIFWPMYFGEPVWGVTGIKSFNNVLLSDETYNTVYWVADLYKGIGTNVSQDGLFIYHRFTGLYRLGTLNRIKIMLSEGMSCTGWWLYANKGEEKIVKYPTPCNSYLENLLKSNLVVSR